MSVLSLKLYYPCLEIFNEPCHLGMARKTTIPIVKLSYPDYPAVWGLVRHDAHLFGVGYVMCG